MYLLYLDESGNENDPNDRHFVLGGLAVFERSTFFLTKAIEDVQDKHFPNHQPIPFHASEIRSGRELWRAVPVEKRQEVIDDLCAAIRSIPASKRFLFAAAVEKSRGLWGEAAVERDIFRGPLRCARKALGSGLPPEGNQMGRDQQPCRHSILRCHARVSAPASGGPGSARPPALAHPPLALRRLFSADTYGRNATILPFFST